MARREEQHTHVRLGESLSMQELHDVDGASLVQDGEVEHHGQVSDNQ